MTSPVALADLVEGRAAGPDGYVRLGVDASAWEALAAGCAAGLRSRPPLPSAATPALR